MAEVPDARVKDNGSPRDLPELKRAISDTRSRLSSSLTHTGQHLHELATAPSSSDTAMRDTGLVGAATRTIAFAGRAKHVWLNARAAGPRGKILLAVVAISGALIAIQRVRARHGHVHNSNRMRL